MKRQMISLEKNVNLVNPVSLVNNVSLVSLVSLVNHVKRSLFMYLKVNNNHWQRSRNKRKRSVKSWTSKNVTKERVSTFMTSQQSPLKLLYQNYLKNTIWSRSQRKKILIRRLKKLKSRLTRLMKDTTNTLTMLRKLWKALKTKKKLYLLKKLLEPRYNRRNKSEKNLIRLRLRMIKRNKILKNFSTNLLTWDKKWRIWIELKILLELLSKIL